MGELIKQTRNIFIDSETNRTIDSTQVSVNLVPNDFYCNSNEEMRLTLTTFEMRMNWHNINQNNSVFYIFTPTTAGSVTGTYYQVQVAKQTFYDFIDGTYQSDNIVTSTTVTGLSTSLTTALTTAAASNAVVGVFPNAGLTLTGNLVTYSPNTRKFTFTLTVDGTLITSNSYFVSFQVARPNAAIPTNVVGTNIFQDTNEILGGNPTTYIPSTANGPPISLFGTGVFTSGTPGNLVFTSPYVAQLNSIEALYLRSNLQTANYSTYGFSQSVFQNAVQPTGILARIPMSRTYNFPPNPFVTFEDANDTFQIQVGNKQLDNLTLFLTDDKGRFIPLVTAGQVVNGMLSFKATIKWQVVVRDQATPFIPTMANLTDKLYAFPRQP